MTRVLIVIGVRLYREGLAQLLDARKELTIVGSESTGRDAIERLNETAPDVALVDMNIPDIHEISTVLAQRAPRIPLVAIGIGNSDWDVLKCAELGATGYIACESSVEQLAAAVHSAADGELTCSAGTAAILIRRLSELAAERHSIDSVGLLTRREREVAALMCTDLSNKDIATRLHIELATVKNHVHNILDKLRVHRRAEAVRLLAHTPNRPDSR
jgi:two-component system nitrate/nitrite response regulator NarL